MDTLDEKEMAQNMLNGEFFDDGDVTAVANDYLRLRAENEALKSDAVNWGAWRERVAAEFFQSDRFGMNDIWLAITALIRQRDEAREGRGFYQSQLFQARAAWQEAHDVAILSLTARAEASEKRASHFDELQSRYAAQSSEEFRLRLAAEKERDEARKSYHTAIELADVQKYATLLDERDALVGKMEAVERDYMGRVAQNAAMREALEKADHGKGCASERRRNSSPPFELFKGPICKGCYALNTQCGKCEKCKWERQAGTAGTQPCDCWKSRALAALNPTA